MIIAILPKKKNPEKRSRVYGMKIHELRKIHSKLKVVRVPGGWLYHMVATCGHITKFVPFSNEFNPKINVQNTKSQKNEPTYETIPEIQ